jgi:hypothetical protein
MGKGNFEKGGKGDFDVLLGIAVFSPDNTAFLASSLILAQKKQSGPLCKNVLRSQMPKPYTVCRVQTENNQ